MNILSLHDIPGGRLPEPLEFEEVYYAPHQGPQWSAADGINILGTPLGSPSFVEQYLQEKLSKHKTLLEFIKNVAKAGFSREAHKMMTAAVLLRLIHVLKSVPKDDASTTWMKEVDDVHLTTWMTCIGGESLIADLPPTERDHLAASLDLPPQFGGVGLQSLIRAADEELLGSWASITSHLISFFRSKDMPVYTKLADTLDAMADSPEKLTVEPAIPAIESMLATGARAHAFLEIIP